MPTNNRDSGQTRPEANDLLHGWWHIIKATIAGLHRHSWLQNFAVAIPILLISTGGAVFVTNKQLAVIVITVGFTFILWGAAVAIFLKIGELDHRKDQTVSSPGNHRAQPSTSSTPKREPPITYSSPNTQLLQSSSIIPQPVLLAPADLIGQAAFGHTLSDVSQFGGPFTIDYTGSFVDWTLYLLYVRDNYSGGLEITCTDMPTSPTRIIFTVDSFGNEYLQKVQIEREKQTFHVRGYVERVGSAEIWLQSTSIEPSSY